MFKADIHLKTVFGDGEHGITCATHVEDASVHDKMVLDADNKTDLIQVHHALEKAVVDPDDVRGVGEWEEKEVFDLENTTIEQMQSARCSVCGKYHTTPFRYYFSEYNYCPNCGAKMKGAEDGTTDNA